MPTSKLARLAQIYREQLGIYQQMLALAEEQVMGAEKGDMTEFSKSLRRRDELSSKLDGLADSAREIGEQLGKELGLDEVNLSALRGRLPGSQIEPVANALSELASIIMQIQALDERTATVLKDVVSGIKGQVPEVQRSQVAMKAYTKFIDRNK